MSSKSSIWIILSYMLSSIHITLSENRPYALKIIKGVDSSIEFWPFLVQIMYKTKFACGGSVVSDKWVVTAGHCFQNNLDKKPENFYIYTDSTIAKKGTRYNVEAIKLHDKFHIEEDKITADIALVLIKEVFKFSDTLDIIKIDFDERLFDTNYNDCSTAGWGQTNVSIPANKMVDLRLQELAVISVPHDDCKKAFEIDWSNVCVKPANGKGSACSGDSGGPLFCDGYLVGVVSFGEDECNGLTAYTKISSYSDWLRGYVKELKEKFKLRYGTSFKLSFGLG